MNIAVFGAGSIGLYVGGALLASGAEVTLVGRLKVWERIERHGLKLTDTKGRRVRLAMDEISFAQHPAAMAAADLILVTVKSPDTAVAAQAIAEHAKPGALVISLQNGLDSVLTLRQALPGRTVLAAMVPFNVAQQPGGRLHRGTEGEIVIQASAELAPWRAVFARANLPLLEHAHIECVQWGKMLLNLNNPVNALSALPLKDQLSQRDYRRCFAMLMREALVILSAAGIRPASVIRLGPRLLPWVLCLPDAVFQRVARTMLRIDPQARSSMWDDLQAGRPTEIDSLNGAVVALGLSVGKDAPVNRRMVALIHTIQTQERRSYRGEELLRLLNGQPERRAPSAAEKRHQSRRRSG